MIDLPEVVHTRAHPAAVIRLTVPREEIQQQTSSAISEVVAAVMAQGIEPSGPVFAHHFKLNPDLFDLEVGVQVTAPVKSSGRVKPGGLPSTTVLRTVYHGPHDGLDDAWDEFIEILESAGESLAADFWERYLTNPWQTSDPTSCLTELNFHILDDLL